ncbi:MAG: hypothetical protein GEV11_27260 [Streptosporangiales bacterium]|nr:hypothetical protein [Streptosporangiales bacterium]
MRVPPSASLAAWGNAWLTGHVGLDEAADAIERTGPHVVVGLPGDPGELPLRRALGELRPDGLSGLRLALPVPGDLLGLCGPPDFNAAALDAGQAVIGSIGDHRRLGLVPAEDRRGSSYVGVRWDAYEAANGRPDVPPLAEAEHGLSIAIRAATSTLMSLDDATTWSPEIAEALTALREEHRHAPTGGLAPGYPARAHRVATLAGRLSVVVALALEDEARGISSDQMADRREALRDLDRAVRRAQVAACNSVFERAR